MKEFCKTRWSLVRTDRAYRSAFRIGAVIFAVLMFCFLALPSATYEADGLTVEYPAYRELFYGELVIGAITFDTGAMWPSFLGYLSCFFAGLGPFFVLERKSRIWSTVLSIFGFILVVIQPVMTILDFSSVFPTGSFKLGLGYILPLVYALAIVISNAVVTVVEPRTSSPSNVASE